MKSMNHHTRPEIALFITLILGLSACGTSSPSVNIQGTVDAQVQATVAAGQTKATSVAMQIASNSNPAKQGESTPTVIPAVATKAVTPTPTDAPVIPPTTVFIPCSKWNLAADFQLWPHQENPSRDACGNKDVWYYLASPSLDRNTSRYYLLPAFTQDKAGIVGIYSWHDMNSLEPSLAMNATGKVQNLWGAWPPGKLVVHPGPNKLVVAAWRSPFSGHINIVGSITDKDNACGDGVNWYLDKGDTGLMIGAIDNGGSQDIGKGLGGAQLNGMAISKGDFIYLAIHPKGEYECDSTFIELEITAVQ